MSEHNPKPMNKEELEKYIERDFLPSLLSKFPNIPDLVAENARLKAEVERLRKAGDALALEVIYFVGDYDPVGSESLRNWDAAKEGKQS